MCRSIGAVALIAALSTSLLGCEWGGSFQAGWVGGAERFYTYDEWGPQTELDVILDQASRDLDCPLTSLKFVQPYKRAYIVMGCGHRGAFMTFKSGFQSANIPGHEAAVVSYWRAVDITAPTEPPATPARTNPYDIKSFVELATSWVELVKQGAKDLKCAPAEVIPDFVPQGRAPSIPLAEGCGKRATYVQDSQESFRLLSMVDMK